MRTTHVYAMSDTQDHSGAESRAEQTTEREELRTLSFRMREIQRLLSVRVEQENRRLEANGLEPVSDGRFREERATDSDTTT